MDSQGSQQPRFDIFELTLALQWSWGPILNLAGNSNFLDFFTKPNNIGVYGLHGP